MAELLTTDKMAIADDSTREVFVGSDSFFSRRAGGWYLSSGSVMRINHRLEPIWSKSYFSVSNDPESWIGKTCWAREIALTEDEQYLYAVGEGILGNLLKLDAATGEIVWSRETEDPHFRYLALDADENILIFGVDKETQVIGTLKKYSPDGTLLWTKSIGSVTGIACDSNNYIYLTVTSGVYGTPVTAAGLYKLDPSDGAQVWYAAATTLVDIAISGNDDIFVIGTKEVFETVECQLFKYRPDANTRLAATPVGFAGYAEELRQLVVCDSLGNAIAINLQISNEYILGKYTSDLVEVWTYEYPTTDEARVLSTDAHNRVHVHGVSPTLPSYQIHDPADGDIVFANDRAHGGAVPFGLVCSRKVYLGVYTDQMSSISRPDMCCFHDATKAKIDYGDAMTEDEIRWLRIDNWVAFVWNYVYPADVWTGMFRAVRDIPAAPQWALGNSEQLEMISRTPSCENVNWDAYDYGGVGNAPQVYTVTFAGILDVADPGELSPYNGEYLLAVGPGLMGFFFRHEHDGNLKINFTVEDVYLDLEASIDSDIVLGDGDEKLIFTVGDDEGNVFNFSTSSNHNEKLTAVVNENILTTPDAIGYGGTASIYPGKINQWDSTTVWAAADIVAWGGRFYQADNENSNSEPPSDDWTVL